MFTCPECGAAIKNVQKYCSKCGCQLIGKNTTIKKEKPTKKSNSHSVLIISAVVSVLTTILLTIFVIYFFIDNKHEIDTDHCSLDKSKTGADEIISENINDSHKQRLDKSVLYGNFPEASQRYLKHKDLANKSKEDLKIMRNEIFARHGRIFKSGGEMEAYFIRQPWYNAQYHDVSSHLTGIEMKNILLIKEYEKKLKGRMLAKHDEFYLFWNEFQKAYKHNNLTVLSGMIHFNLIEYYFEGEVTRIISINDFFSRKNTHGILNIPQIVNNNIDKVQRKKISKKDLHNDIFSFESDLSFLHIGQIVYTVESSYLQNVGTKSSPSLMRWRDVFFFTKFNNKFKLYCVEHR